ncbi:hypothetical protein MHU86_12794 [Fragilaria crotonensis]|nr:hypothetical protein MHU86_12794 [Fragilaria crotonensis]
MSPGGPTPTPHCGLQPRVYIPYERENLNPLAKLAAVACAAPRHPTSINDNGICNGTSTGTDSQMHMHMKSTLHPTLVSTQIHSQIRLIPVRFILQKPHHALAWGISFSMIQANSNFLIVGYVDRTLMHHYTVQASIDTKDSNPFNIHQGQHCPVASLRPGDIILSINGRAIASFSSFLKITEHLKNSSYLWITAMRASHLPQHILANNQPQLSHRAAEETHRLLRPLLSQLVRHVPINPFPMREDASFQIRKATTSSQPPPKPPPKQTVLMHVIFSNPLFRDDCGKPLPYDDDLEFDPDDGSRAKDFLVQIDAFPSWLAARKTVWRQRWTVRALDEVVIDVEDDSPTDVSHDFWSHQGFSSFEQWQSSRIAQWKGQYSWNQRKRKRIEEDAEEIVHFPCVDDTDNEMQLLDWLRVRKNQWKILRRKHQRRLEQTTLDNSTTLVAKRAPSEGNGGKSQESNARTTILSPNPVVRRQTTGDMLLIDSLLEEQESKRQANLKTFDLAFVFDAKLGAPDDVVAHCLRYLPPSEHGKLLCINLTTSSAIKERDDLWRQLCPTHWILPRRPRKRWHDLYLSKIRQEADVSRKRSEDLLSTVANVLFKGDHFQKVEKLVTDGEQKFAFDVNYVSGVVCERNSILNLAVIHGRYKVVRWLVETKGSDVESSDRGGFTPLLNAAWAGNTKLVRFLMSHGCDRTKIGRGHYTKPLAAPDFKGYTAEGWAREREFPEVAELLRLGL